MKISMFTIGVLFSGAFAITSCTNAEVTKELETLRSENLTLKADLDTCRVKHEEALEDMEEAFTRLQEKDAELKAMLEKQTGKK